MKPNRSKHSTALIDEYVSEPALRRAPLICTQETERYAEAWCRARAGIERAMRSMHAKMRKRPFAAVMGALAFGVIVGALSGRRR